jgi:4-amino-4-deoxy-L-arabinose transferase-like glycosyltransferase
VLSAGAAGAVARARVGEPALLAVAALTLLAAVLRFVGIGHQGFWFDEGNTALLVHLSPGKMLGLIPKSESTPPLYYCVAWVWAHLFGYAETPLRSLSALAGVLTVPVMFATGRRLFSTRVGLIAAALTATNPLLIWYSQEARSYSLLVLFSALTLWAFAAARAQPAVRALAVWVIACALALATHYYALLAVVPEAIWLVVEHRRRRGVLVAVGAVGLCGLALLPLALSQNGTGNASWIAPIQLQARLDQIAPVFLKGFQIPAQSVLEPLAFACAGLGLGLAVVRGDARERRLAAATGALALAGLAINLILIAVGVDDVIARNVLALWPAAALTIAAGLGVRRAGPLGLLGAIVLCAIGITGAVSVQARQLYQRPDWRGVARLLGARPAPGQAQRVIFVQHYRDLLPLSLYVPHVKFVRHTGVRVTELDIVAFTAPRVHLCWWGAACNLSGTDMQASYAIPGFHPVWRRRFEQFTVLRLVADAPTLVTPHRVARALTTTRFADDELLVQR